MILYLTYFLGFLNNLVSIAIWMIIAYLFNFSIFAILIGFVIGYLFRQFIGSLIIMWIVKKYIEKNQ